MDPIRLQLPFQLSDRQISPLIRLGMLMDDEAYRVAQVSRDIIGGKETTVLVLVTE